MSLLERLFPLQELEALGNKYHDPSNKKRKLEGEASQSKPRKQNKQDSHDHRRHTMSDVSKLSRPITMSTSLSRSTEPSIKRSNSSSQSTSLTTASRSCLPNFIEPSLLKNYLQHLHPKDRHRYSMTNTPEPEVSRASSQRGRTPIENEENTHSPASMVTDTSSPSSSEGCATPSAAMFEQFRSGPFGHLFNGMRLTEHERDFMEDLLGPTDLATEEAKPAQAPIKALVASQTLVHESKVGSREIGVTRENSKPVVPVKLEDKQEEEEEEVVTYRGFSIGRHYDDDDDDEDDVHSSGMSPINDTEMEPLQLPQGHNSKSLISVQDFFDLEEASVL
ncbi:hypothetical protein PV10_08189 [Exophiala mesophila]|uniref:Uncharacterized protein n=1 Tax=Exophiala mesophila TaxID=212818 RepID=A0A0D1ZP51_EXOME|nr:uncharacterized protein PV10_08189 [Exophiala mesophila]KIV88508.1 hypothetical protein PV10_08189 [Exophiala mesophila]